MFERILVPLDGGPVSTAGLDAAIRLAQCCNATLRLLHVLDAADHVAGYMTPKAYYEDVVPRVQAGGRQILEQARQRAAACGVACDTQVIETSTAAAADLVLEHAAAWPADLIVLGTHGRRGLDRLLLGSSAEQVARSARVPVLLVRVPREGVFAARSAQ
jgi:nucleotide-binding universal stress UspA family protein